MGLQERGLPTPLNPIRVFSTSGSFALGGALHPIGVEDFRVLVFWDLNPIGV